MKLQSQISRKYKDKNYEKFWIVLPSEKVKKLNWKSGDELTAEINDEGVLIIKK